MFVDARDKDAVLLPYFPLAATRYPCEAAEYI